jgi:hypothetical protein
LIYQAGNLDMVKIMQTKTTYFGQHFLLSIVKNGKDTTLILSNSDETKNHVVFTDNYELKELADFLYKTIGEKK